jgi:hypothetical protein
MLNTTKILADLQSGESSKQFMFPISYIKYPKDHIGDTLPTLLGELIF